MPGMTARISGSFTALTLILPLPYREKNLLMPLVTTIQSFSSSVGFSTPPFRMASALMGFSWYSLKPLMAFSSSMSAISPSRDLGL